jgi:hypothetical protein
MQPCFRTWTFIAAIAICSSISTPAYSQWYAGPGGWGGWGYGWGSAQTPMSANAIGMSHVIQAAGQYNEQTSRALMNYQQAESTYIDNQQKWFNARQSVIRAAKAKDLEDKQTAHAALDRANEFEASHQPLPLPNSELHPSTGQIVWPTALLAPEYSDSRKALEGMFQSRTRYGSSANLTTQIKDKVNEMKDQLREQITKIPLSEYSQARRFLDSMIASAQ